ncbi:transposase [Candidatus Kaiserbacteria bacterium]|nr:transposase [Candidatus Kaiserbacteria bacterium]
MATRQPMVTGEWYHCYNRGVDKRIVFQSKHDYERFQALMYVCNGTTSNPVSDHRDTSLLGILNNEHIKRGKPLVQIGAYALMPNHAHFIFKEIREGGIASYMRKLFTGYTMYFNIKRKRTGALFAGSFKSKHIDRDEYFKHVLAYVLLNPAEINEPQWKKGAADVQRIEKKLLSYPYSSTSDFFGLARAEKKIVEFSTDEFYDRMPTLSSLLKDARAYYAEVADVGR